VGITKELDQKGKTLSDIEGWKERAAKVPQGGAAPGGLACEARGTHELSLVTVASKFHLLSSQKLLSKCF
jgi:hypothetical protein